MKICRATETVSKSFWENCLSLPKLCPREKIHFITSWWVVE